MKSEVKVHLRSEKDLAGFAEKLATSLPKETTIGLLGPLGAGKTTFVRYFCEALGAKGVASPTYVLEHEYIAKSGLLISHWDLYRLTEFPAELREPVKENSIRLIEWADRFPELLESLDLILNLDFVTESPEEARQVCLSGPLCSSTLAP